MPQFYLHSAKAGFANWLRITVRGIIVRVKSVSSVEHSQHPIAVVITRAQWLRGRASYSRLREAGFESCASA